MSDEEDSSEVHGDSSSMYFTYSSGTSTPTEYNSSDFASPVDISEQKVVDEQLVQGIRINIPGLDR